MYVPCDPHHPPARPQEASTPGGTHRGGNIWQYLPCPTGSSFCPAGKGRTVCVDLATDPMNCGQCKHACSSGGGPGRGGAGATSRCDPRLSAFSSCAPAHALAASQESASHNRVSPDLAARDSESPLSGAMRLGALAACCIPLFLNRQFRIPQRAARPTPCPLNYWLNYWEIVSGAFAHQFSRILISRFGF